MVKKSFNILVDKRPQSIRYLFLFLYPVLLFAQLEIDLPPALEIFIQEKRIPLSAGWIDSLLNESKSGKLHYGIAAAHADEENVITRLRIPQVLSLRRVFYQVIFYYSFLSSEQDRIKEQLYIYPYFTDINDKPAIICTYRVNGQYHFIINHWPVIPVPPTPGPEEKWIYNQIIELMLNDVQKMGNPSNEIFTQIAEKNNLPVNRVIQIYQETVLWQESQ